MNPRILMIEDDASICDMTKMNLNMNGFSQVFCASDGRKGLEMAARRALEQCGRDLPWQVCTVHIDGTVTKN